MLSFLAGSPRVCAVLPGYEFKAAGWTGDDQFHTGGSSSYANPDLYGADAGADAGAFDWEAYYGADFGATPPSPPDFTKGCPTLQPGYSKAWSDQMGSGGSHASLQLHCSLSTRRTHAVLPVCSPSTRCTHAVLPVHSQ